MHLIRAFAGKLEMHCDFSYAGRCPNRRIALTLFILFVLLATGMITTVLPVAAGSTWNRAAPMPLAKDEFGAVAVGGRIYAIGGQTGPDPTPLSDVQMFDPTADTWVRLSPMPSTGGPVRAAAIDSVVYVFTYLNGVHAFDTMTDSWSTRSVSPGPLLVPGVAAVENSIFVIGGFSGEGRQGGISSNAVYEYDVKADHWSARSAMPTNRSHHQTVVLGGLIYVLGGSNQSGPLSTVEVYDPVADRWSSGTALPEPMENFGAVVIHGRIHVLLHSSHYVYSAATNRWVESQPMTVPRHGFGAVLVHDVLYIVGGCYQEPRFNTPHNEVMDFTSHSSSGHQPVVWFLLLVSSIAAKRLASRQFVAGLFRLGTN